MVPVATGVTIPVEPIVAILVLLLDHVPPVVALANVVVEPLHLIKVPVIAAGVPSTTTCWVALILDPLVLQVRRPEKEILQ